MTEPPAAAESDAAAVLGPWREVRSGVYVAIAEPESVNLGLIVGSRGALLVDTGSSPAQGRTLRSSVGTVTDRPLTAVVVTHWHYDHAFGLAAFPDVPKIAHESVRFRLLSAEAAAEAERLSVDPHELGQPSVVLAVATALDLGERRWRSLISGAGIPTETSSSWCRTPTCCSLGTCWNQPGHRRSAPTRFLMNGQPPSMR